jgi:cbb3-type cytochrome c oxidase subunit III
MSHFRCFTPITIVLAALLLNPAAAFASHPQSKGGTIQPDVLYHNYCSVCHGDRGDGRSRAQGSLTPPPRDFTTAGELTREAMITIVTHGKSGTAMVGWKTQLSDEEVASLVDYIRKTFMVVALDPRLQKGKGIYIRNCAVCHGERGQGSNLPVGGPTLPRNLASPQSREELTRERMITSVTQGRPGTAMAAFGNRLAAEDISAVVDYVRAALMVPETSISGTKAHGGRKIDTPTTLSTSTTDMSLPFPEGLVGNAAKGGKFYNANCATCHGIKGDGKGPRAYFINPKPRIFTEPSFQARFNRPAVYAATSMGRLGTEMPAWSKVLSKQEIADVSEYVFQKFILAGQKARKPTK